MNEPPTHYTKVLVVSIVVSVVVSLSIFMALTAWTGLFTEGERLENLEVTSLTWDNNLDGATLLLKNTGETALRISQLEINDMLLSQEEWDCYPSPNLEPGDEAYLQVSPSLIGFRESSIYIFGLITESGKKFRRTFATPKTFTFTGTEQLEIQSCVFNLGNTDITLTVQNTGTADLTVTSWKEGNTGTPTALASEVPVEQGQQTSVTVPLAWSAGTTYDIYLITATGKQFMYRATAP